MNREAKRELEICGKVERSNGQPLPIP